MLRPFAGSIVLATGVALAQPAQPADEAREAARQFDALYGDVRDRRIDRELARAQVQTLIPRITADFYARGGGDAPKDSWRFPLAGYGAESIGGRLGSGYIVEGYDWFDGYASRGHPGHDIFIVDRNCRSRRAGVLIRQSVLWPAARRSVPGMTSSASSPRRWA